MKKLIAIGTVALMLGSTGIYAQGWITALNDGTTRVLAGDSAAAAWGVAPGTPTPTSAGLVAQVFYAPISVVNPTENDLNGIGIIKDFITISAGRFNIGNVELPSTPAAQDAWIQIRVWEKAYGADLPTALAAPAQNGRMTIAGYSGILRVTAGDVRLPSTLTDLAFGLASFNVTVVPEPSAIALGILGLAGFILLRRRS